MNETVYLVVGAPASGKSWVCEQLRDLYDYIRHDDYIDGSYLEVLEEAAKFAMRPILAETPFSVSQIQKPLESQGIEVVTVFILEDEDVLRARWADRHEHTNRDGEAYPQGNISRQRTYALRAEESSSFSGTSEEVLAHLLGLRGKR